MPVPLLPPLRTCLTYTKYTAGALFAASVTSAWYYRPIADPTAAAPRRRDTELNRRARADETFCAPYISPPWARERVPLLLDWARRLSIGATTVAIRLLMNTYGTYEIEDDEAYRRFLRTVLGGNGRRPDQGLLTVSNHRSLFDDPGVVSCLLPLPIAIQPRYNRWGLCSQEYCFNGALPGLVKGYIGAGQVLPICRGGGIDQRALLDFARHLACGEWCHVFPEGGVWQWDELGGRRELPDRADGPAGRPEDILPGTRRQQALPPAAHGKLKWGVGKLIAHAPVPPRVIPFAHHGMERLLPQDADTGRTGLRDGPLAGLLPGRPHVRVRFGEEIAFDDLVRGHEARHGKLWKYGGKLDAEERYYDEEGRGASGGDEGGGGHSRHERWASSAEERALYSQIARRIESRLEVISREVCQQERGKR